MSLDTVSSVYAGDWRHDANAVFPSSLSHACPFGCRKSRCDKCCRLNQSTSLSPPSRLQGKKEVASMQIDIRGPRPYLPARGWMMVCLGKKNELYSQHARYDSCVLLQSLHNLLPKSHSTDTFPTPNPHERASHVTCCRTTRTHQEITASRKAMTIPFAVLSERLWYLIHKFLELCLTEICSRPSDQLSVWHMLYHWFHSVLLPFHTMMSDRQAEVPGSHYSQLAFCSESLLS